MKVICSVFICIWEDTLMGCCRYMMTRSDEEDDDDDEEDDVEAEMSW